MRVIKNKNQKNKFSSTHSCKALKNLLITLRKN